MLITYFQHLFYLLSLYAIFKTWTNVQCNVSQQDFLSLEPGYNPYAEPGVPPSLKKKSKHLFCYS